MHAPTDVEREAIVAAVRLHARALSGVADIEPVVAAMGHARLVLLGEATHGTHEFYRLRAEITKRLILAHGFDAIAVEADWPDALRVSRHIQGAPEDSGAVAALCGFSRFPLWMWRNAETVELVDWLHAYNREQPPDRAPVGFYGLDLYSLRASAAAVIRYLNRTDRQAARKAKARYACFGVYGGDPEAYGHATRFGLRDDCEREVVDQLRDLLRDPARYLRRDGVAAADELFYAQQNARVVRSAERYYRSMFGSHTEAWNLRDTHMADMLDALQAHLGDALGRPPRIVVWAHNSHVGDARATAWGQRGQLSLGQLVRERHPASSETFLLGLTTHTGTVAAASDWGAPVQVKTVRPSRTDCIERLFHDSGLPIFLLAMADGSETSSALSGLRLQRAIGVVYRPDGEPVGNYFPASLPRQFDAVVHVDRSEALLPLDEFADLREGAAAETYPTGL